MNEYPREGAGLPQYLKDLFSGDKYEDATNDSAWQEDAKIQRQKEKERQAENKRKGKSG